MTRQWTRESIRHELKLIENKIAQYERERDRYEKMLMEQAEKVARAIIPDSPYLVQ